MLTLSPTETIRCVADSASSITATILGMELNGGVEAYKVLAQAQCATSITTVYTAPSSTQAFIKSFFLVNTTGSSHTVRVYIGGTASSNSASVQMTIPNAGFATMQEDGWKVYDSDGNLVMKVSNSSLAQYPYKYNASTANSDPTSGYFTFDIAPPTTSCVRMNLSKTNANSLLLGTLLDFVLRGVARVVIQNAAQTALTIFNVTSVVNQTNHYELTGTCAAANISFGTNADDIYYVNITAAVSVDIQTFTANGTWTKPVGAQFSFMRGIGSGASGGGGRRDASSAARSGGSGGSGGFMQERWLPASLLGATEAVVVGAAVTGGAGATSNGVSGTDGTNGNDTIIGTAPNIWIKAPGGTKGVGGSSTSVTRGAANAAFTNGTMYLGCDGGIGEITDVATSPTMSANASTSANAYRGGGGGGGGGAGNPAANTTTRTGGTGGLPYASTSIATGGSQNNAGSNANVAGGGGGGGGSGSIDGGAGGNGLAPGGGGGGGGAGTANNGGAGGSGARGEARVYTICS